MPSPYKYKPDEILKSIFLPPDEKSALLKMESAPDEKILDTPLNQIMFPRSKYSICVFYLIGDCIVNVECAS